jgi:hypothetical protein
LGAARAMQGLCPRGAAQKAGHLSSGTGHDFYGILPRCGKPYAGPCRGWISFRTNFHRHGAAARWRLTVTVRDDDGPTIEVAAAFRVRSLRAGPNQARSRCLIGRLATSISPIGSTRRAGLFQRNAGAGAMPVAIRTANPQHGNTGLAPEGQ